MPTRQARGFSAASPSSTAAHRADQAAAPAAFRLVLKAVLVVSRIRAPPVSSPAGHAPNIPHVRVLPAQALEVPAVQVDPAADLALAHVPALARHVPAVLVALALPAAHRLRAKRRARRDPLGRRVAVAVSSIPRPKKAR